LTPKEGPFILPAKEARVPDIYVDADGCPVKEEVYRATEKYGLTVYVVCNSPMSVPLRDRIRLIVVEKGPDVADNWIADHVAEGDIVITGDIPLADRSIKKGARVLDNRGREFTENSIGASMATRDLMDHLRMMGVVSGGPPPVVRKDRSNFLAALHEIIQAQLRG
jgi:uncharacterized protein